METPLHTFVPYDLSLPTSVWLSLVVMLVAALGTAYFLRPSPDRSQRNMRMLGAMLLFFVAIMALGTGFFSFWNSRRTLAPVTLFTDRIESGYGVSKIKDLRSAYMKVEDRLALFPTVENTKKDTFLIVEQKDGRSHVFSSQEYPVKKMTKVIRELMK